MKHVIMDSGVESLIVKVGDPVGYRVGEGYPYWTMYELYR